MTTECKGNKYDTLNIWINEFKRIDYRTKRVRDKGLKERQEDKESHDRWHSEKTWPVKKKKKQNI